MTAYRTVAYTPDRRPELFALMDEVWGGHMPHEEFEWWFERNPVGRRLVALAESDEGEVVGVAAMSSFRMELDGEERVVTMPVHVATHPGWRRRGVFPRLELANEEQAAADGAPIALTFPNAASHRIFVGPLGWVDLPRRHMWARPLRPGALVRYALRRPTRRSGELRPRSTGPSAYGDVRVEPASAFGVEADALWRASRGLYGSHVIRDAAFLNWRYADSPRDYRVFGAYRGAELRGLAVMGHTFRHGVSAGFLADLIAPPGARAETRALLRRCLAEVADADAFVALPPPGQRPAFVSLGFAPTNVVVRFIGKVLQPEGYLAAGPWHFTLGDFDFF